MEKETKAKDFRSLILLGAGIAAGTAIGYATGFLLTGIFLGAIAGIALAWFVRLRGA